MSDQSFVSGFLQTNCIGPAVVVANNLLIWSEMGDPCVHVLLPDQGVLCVA